jgi:hypothetical protein
MEVEVSCPYCGEPTVIFADEVGGRSVEDCVVCCRPMDVLVYVDSEGEGAPQVSVTRLDG